MALAHAPSLVRPSADPIPVHQISSKDLNEALREGWTDFMRFRGDIILVGLLYPIVGLIAATVTLGGTLIPLFFPIAAGIALLGPLVAIGFYELARRREEGLESDWTHFFDVRKRPSAGGIGGVAAMLVALFAIWLFVAAALFLTFWGLPVPDTIGGFLTRLFTTPEGWALIIVGNAVGALFAVLVLAVSVVSLPMLVDCDVDPRVAVATSIKAFQANRAGMIRWGLTIAVLLVIGSIPAFLGLAVVLPWLGYATWHLYTRLVDRSALKRYAA